MAAEYPRRMNAAEFLRMGEDGFFENLRVELIDGEIVEMSAQGGPHVRTVNRLTRMLPPMLGTAASVSVQNSIPVDDRYVPQPDLVVLRGQDEDNSLPGLADALIVVEVSDSTLASDRAVKLPRYAAARVAEVWIVNIGGQQLERYTEPGPEGYRMVARAGRGQTLASTVISAVVLDAGAVLGPPLTEGEIGT